jgi:hypothetical protein
MTDINKITWSSESSAECTPLNRRAFLTWSVAAATCAALGTTALAQEIETVDPNIQYVFDEIEKRENKEELLQLFSWYDKEDQGTIANIIIGSWGWAFDLEDLKRYNEFLTNFWKSPILQEAEKNGADTDFDIPWYDDLLTDLAQTWEIGRNDLIDIFDIAPKNSQHLPVIIAMLYANETEQTLSQSEQTLSQSEQTLRQSEQNLHEQQRIHQLLESLGERLSI